jgi:tetratricopeptide (TPR) repeat protein
MGKTYFEENKGHFWGLVETRPYMRACSFLVEGLRIIGKTSEAISHAEDMLELNPNDNQGIRDSLLGMYLETGNLEGARMLFKNYSSEFFAVFLWGRVLERYLSGDPKGASRIFRKASERNPHVFDYLTGRKRPSMELGDFYSPGDESEAILCLEEIGPAWQKHPEAIEWLKSLQ